MSGLGTPQQANGPEEDQWAPPAVSLAARAAGGAPGARTLNPRIKYAARPRQAFYPHGCHTWTRRKPALAAAGGAACRAWHGRDRRHGRAR